MKCEGMFFKKVCKNVPGAQGVWPENIRARLAYLGLPASLEPVNKILIIENVIN
jgi:hypothetical protein